MEISNLLGKITHKEEPIKHFLALELTDDIVQGAVWCVVDGTTEVSATGTPIPWNGDAGNLTDLVAAADTTITKACENLTQTPTEVIFEIPSTWLDGDSLKPEKKNYIKKIVTDLELKPLGYVVIMDSLIRFLRMQEGTPITSILIQVSDTDLTIASVVLGKTHHLKVISRSDDVVKDVEAGIAACVNGLAQLPSRFIVFDGMHDLDEVVQNLTLVDWTSKFPFLHIPKVESLQKDIIIRALCVAGGSEVAKSIGFAIKEEDNSPAPPSPPPATQSQDNPPSADLASLGFSPTEENHQETVETSPPPHRLNIPSLLSFFKLPKFALPKFTTPSFSAKLLIPLAILALGFFAFATSLWLFSKATVTIFLTPRTETQQFTIDLSSSPIQVSEVEATAEGSDSIETTGTKTTGDKSSGEVTLYNRTPQKKTFPKGTILTSGKLKFTLDEEVSVASKSAGVDYIDIPGKAVAKITAEAIGEESNLPADTEFVVANYSKDSFIAKNELPLKGGTSRTVSAVSAKDKNELFTRLKSKLEEEARSSLASTNDHIIIRKNATTIVSEQYSAKIGEEAKTLEATLKLTVKAYVLSNTDLVAMANDAFKTILTNGYQPVGDLVVQLGSANEKSVNVTATIQTLPILDESKIVSSLRGLRDPDAISTILGNSVPGFAGVRIDITPTWLPPRLKSLPRKVENITLKLVVTQQP